MLVCCVWDSVGCGIRWVRNQVGVATGGCGIRSVWHQVGVASGGVALGQVGVAPGSGGCGIRWVWTKFLEKCVFQEKKCRTHRHTHTLTVPLLV